MAALADVVAEQAAGRAPVTILGTPLARAWRDHPAGRGAMSNPGTADVGRDSDREGDVGQCGGAPAGRIVEDRPLKLIGFCCRVCGFARPAGERPPVAPPLCPGAPARPGRHRGTNPQHGPTPMQSLFLH